MKQMLTAQRLREVLHYDPSTGVFIWIKKTGTKSSGSTAGTPHKEYLRIQVDGRLYRAHRLAWLYMTGEWPKQEVDHKNTIGSDNRWDNLRPADRFINLQNQRRAHQNNEGTGLLGSYPAGKKFKASITANGCAYYLGVYDTPNAAHAAYIEAKRNLHQGGTL